MNRASYRPYEQALFRDAGIEPIEHRLTVECVDGSVRVLEWGTGDQVLFLHGGPNAAPTWSYVAAEVARAGFRCLLLDRPGCGLSDPPREVPHAQTLPDYLPSLTAQVLDALTLARVPLVGSSLGGFAAMRTAMEFPERVQGVCLMGCPAFVPEWVPPSFFALLRRPITRALVLRMPATRGGARMSLRMMGHGASLAAGRIPPAMIDWIVAWQAHTDTMRNDTAMIVACGDRHDFDPGLDLTEADLATIRTPVTALFGEADPVGGRSVAETLVAALPDATMQVFPEAGHLPWLDDPVAAGTGIVDWLHRLRR